MTTKSLWQWDKHNVLQFIEKNYYRNYLNQDFNYSNQEFTSEELLEKASKSKFYYGYSERIISEHLLELMKDGVLEVRYESVKVKNINEWYWWNKNKSYFGSKTVAIYKLK